MGSFYDKVYKECEVFFAQGTKRFLDRQIEHHLNKKADRLDYADKEELAKWIRISAGLVLKREDAESLSNKVRQMKP